MTNSLIASPNPILALKAIRLSLEQKRFGDALDALKEFGFLERAYALAIIEVHIAERALHSPTEANP